MAFNRCDKHPDMVLYRCLEWGTLRCRVCDEIRPLNERIKKLIAAAVTFEHFTYPGKGRCRCCTVSQADGYVEMLTGERWFLCRSCTGIVRSRLKSLVKRMEKQAAKMNAEPGQGRPE